MHHDQFRRKRKAIGTQKEVAAKLGISEKTVYRRISEAKHRELANELALALRLVRNINSVCEASLNVDPARTCAKHALSHLKALQHHLQRDYLKSSGPGNKADLYFMPRAAKARIIFE
jgi:hypothetical protein